MVPRGAVSLEGFPCVLLSPSQCARLLWWAVPAFLGVHVQNPLPWRVNRTLIHMIRCPDRTHMKEAMATRTVPRHATRMGVHIASCNLGAEFRKGTKQ